MNALLLLNFAGTAFSVILKETFGLVKIFGNIWQACVFMWTLIFAMTRQTKLALMIGDALTVLLIILVTFLLVHRYSLYKFWDMNFLRRCSKNLIATIFPTVVLKYMWFPCHQKVICTLGFNGSDSNESFPYGTVILAAIVTLLIFVRKNDNNSNGAKKDPSENKIITRSMSTESTPKTIKTESMQLRSVKKERS